MMTNKQATKASDAEIAGDPQAAEVQKLLRMLQVHNSKVEKIRHGYTNYCELRE